MPNAMVLMVGARFLHDLATAVWIGGLLAMGLAVLPALRKRLGPGPQTRQLMQAVQGRLRVLVFASIAVLVVTGALMSRNSPQFLGLLSWGNPYSTVLAWKHLLVIAMVAVAVIRGLAFRTRLPTLPGSVPAPSGQPGEPVQTGRSEGKERLSMLLLLLNMLLGVAVVFLSALSAVIAKGGPQ